MGGRGGRPGVWEEGGEGGLVYERPGVWEGGLVCGWEGGEGGLVCGREAWFVGGRGGSPGVWEGGLVCGREGREAWCVGGRGGRPGTRWFLYTESDRRIRVPWGPTSLKLSYI